MVYDKKFRGVVLPAIFVFLACTANTTVTRQTIIRIDPSTTWQMINGWEATAQAGQFEHKNLLPLYKDTLYDQAVSDLGINRLRVEVFNGAENPVDYFAQYDAQEIDFKQWKSHWFEIFNDNADPFVIDPAGFQFSNLDRTIEEVVLPIRQRLEARGEKLYLNLNYIDFGASDFEHKNYPEEYAEFMLAAFQHMNSKYGLTPDAIELCLESDNAGWTGDQLGQAIVATGNRLRSYGYNPQFIAPSSTNMDHAISSFDQLIKVPGVTEYFSEFSYHRYGGVSDSNLRAIGERAAQSRVTSAHLELIGATYQDLLKDLSLAGNSSWAQYTLAWPLSDGKDNGAQYFVVDDEDPGHPVLRIATRTKFLRQYFKFIRRGALRIGASSDNPAFEPLAFDNYDCRQVVVIKAGIAGGFSIEGLRPGNYGVKYTTEDQYDIDLPDLAIAQGENLATAIPGPGVITVYARSGFCDPVTGVSSASYDGKEVSQESIVSAFASALATGTQIADTNPLPLELGGTSLMITDRLGKCRQAPLFFVSPRQVNFGIPMGTATGDAVIKVVSGDKQMSSGLLRISRIAPGLFTADGSESGIPAGVLLRVKSDNRQVYEPIMRYDPDRNKMTAIPIELGPESDQVFLVLFGTGVRHRSSLSAVTSMIGGIDSEVVYAGALTDFFGIDQITIALPRALIGKGESVIRIVVEGKPANGAGVIFK